MKLIHSKSEKRNIAGSGSSRSGLCKAAAGILAVLLVVVGIFGMTGVSSALAEDGVDTAAENDTDTATEEGTASIYLGDVEVYSVVKDETIVTVPIYAEGGIDMQCYDITVTWDRYLTVQTDEEEIITGITAFEDGYQDVNTDTSGTIRIAGVTLEDGADAADGQVGQLTFLVTSSVTRDGVSANLELTVTELGFGTEASEVAQSGATVTLNKSAAAETETYYYGDVDMNGTVNTTDALMILRHCVKLTDLTGNALILADVDHDEEILVNDALAVLKCVVNLAEKESVELTVE